ncbi:MAG: GspE/PulE family protein [Candidatus Jorgensenbacteria bacterium]|nr:GspE/PulE family protein [Candidatus Jorgensenbacteria bacterium]
MLSKSDLDERLKKAKILGEESDAKRRALALNIPYLNLVSVKIPTEIRAMALVKAEVAREAKLVPFQLLRKKLFVGAFDPSMPSAIAVIDELKKKYEVQIFVVSVVSLEHAWSYYRYVQDEAKEISGQVNIDKERLAELFEKIKTIEMLDQEFTDFKSPLVSKLLEIILGGSMALKSSDIHMEPNQEFGLLRFRIDGILHSVYAKFNMHTYHSIVMRIKLLSNLKLNVMDEPQDGRFTVGLANRDIEIRTSIIPSEFGETVVMRILDPLALKVNLVDLGWRSDDLDIVKKEIVKPNGLILTTGPTGSGKTTTLYAFLKNVYSPEIKIITVEDPIEYHLEGISQTQVNADVNYTFASGLRSILRQDPNVILIGEIRDKETAEIAVNAALTGHLVFSTLHTNDALGAIPRFIDLGAKPNILAPSLNLVIAQRLARVLCPKCKVKKEIPTELNERIKKFISELPTRVDKTHYADFTIYEKKGCTECGNIGYRGRISIFELFQITSEIRDSIYHTPSETELFTLARAQGMVTMQEDGILKVISGVTSIAEVERTTGVVEWLSGALLSG